MGIKFAGAAGAQAIENATKQTNARYQPELYWGKPGSEEATKYIQLIGDENSFYTFLTHNMMQVGTYTNKQGQTKTKYETFISPRDPNVQGAEGVDIIEQRFGLKPKPRTFAIAVEMEPTIEQSKSKSGKVVNAITGFSVKTRTYKDKDNVEHVAPVVGVIHQSPYTETFFPWFTDYANNHDLSEHVFEVTKKDEGTNLRFYIEAAGDALDLSAEDLDVEAEVKNLHEYIEYLADSSRMAELVGALPDEAILDPWRQNKADAKAKPAAKAAKAEPQEEEAEAPSNEVVETDGFAALRNRFAGAK